MPAHEQEFLDRQGTQILWNKVKNLVNKKLSYKSRTAAEWNQDRDYQSEINVIYIYREYKQINGVKVSAIKIGDGTSYLIDLPFVGEEFSQRLENHIADTVAHITNQERDFWNNKVTVYEDTVDNENLILSKN